MTTTEHLRELQAKATPVYKRPSICMGENGELVAYIYHATEPGNEVVRISGNHENVRLIVALVNAAPALLDVVDAAKKYVAYQSDIQGLRESLDKLDEVKL